MGNLGDRKTSTLNLKQSSHYHHRMKAGELRRGPFGPYPPTFAVDYFVARFDLYFIVLPAEGCGATREDSVESLHLLFEI